MEAWLALCDFAEVINGKLYIQGGGWSRRPAAAGPFSTAVAGKLLIPWNETNKRLSLRLALVDSDGATVKDAEGKEIQVLGEFEVGRPPGLAPGTELDFPLAFKLDGLSLGQGRYGWELSVAGERVQTVFFDMF